MTTNYREAELLIKRILFETTFTESAVDMSPFVRKTAAHAIPKLYSLDPEMKDELISIIEKLLADR